MTPSEPFFTIDMEKLNSMDIPSTEHADPTTWNSLLPTYKSVSGPLIYLGFSVFKFQNYLNVGGIDTGTEITIAFLLRLVIIL